MTGVPNNQLAGFTTKAQHATIALLTLRIDPNLTDGDRHLIRQFRKEMARVAAPDADPRLTISGVKQEYGVLINSLRELAREERTLEPGSTEHQALAARKERLAALGLKMTEVLESVDAMPQLPTEKPDEASGESE